MKPLDFSPTSLFVNALTTDDGPFRCVHYHIEQETVYGERLYHLCVVTMARNAYDIVTKLLGKFATAYHAQDAACQHWQEFEERINSALPGEAVAVPEPHWATVPKTTIVSSAEIRRELEEAKAFAHDLGGES